MPFTISRFAEKLRKSLDEFADSTETFTSNTGISIQRLDTLLAGGDEPTGDEILIISDYFRTDFAYFLDDDEIDVNQNLEPLFRKAGGELSTIDRHRVADFIFLCVCQHELEVMLGRANLRFSFLYKPRSRLHKHQGEECSDAFRRALGIPESSIIPDLFDFLRKRGIKLFRRRLTNSNISGLFIMHPIAGICILINYDEVIARQRFSAAHELCHAIMDQNSANLSKLEDTQSSNLIEIRANRFAARLLMPRPLLQSIDTQKWQDETQIAYWASNLMISIPALINSLADIKLISHEYAKDLRGRSLRRLPITGPEIDDRWPTVEKDRVKTVIESGLNQYYINLCFDAYERGLISRQRLAEFLLMDLDKLVDTASLFQISL